MICEFSTHSFQPWKYRLFVSSIKRYFINRRWWKLYRPESWKSWFIDFYNLPGRGVMDMQQKKAGENRYFWACLFWHFFDSPQAPRQNAEIPLLVHLKQPWEVEERCSLGAWGGNRRYVDSSVSFSCLVDVDLLLVETSYSVCSKLFV